MSQPSIAIAMLIAVASHEGAHYLVARWLGVKTNGFRVNWRGIGLARDSGSPIQNFAITLAGPLANFLLTGTVFLAPWFGHLAIIIALVNFYIGGFNLLPFPGSDGMRALALLGYRKQSVEFGDTVATQIGDHNYR
jgi:membrane-associated protease RseP (regulator of RpoE activity)